MKTTKNLVAVAILAAMGLCLAGIYYAGEQLGAGVPGPSKIGLAPDGTVWVASHGGLHHFTGAGERKEKVALSALSRGAIISELLPLSDGTLVLAEAVPSAAYRCDVAARACTSITAKVAASNGPTAHALMIAADEQRGRFYISDNANHRLLLLDFDGKLLDVTAPRRLLYPNELAVEKSGQLVVVDTTHRRLVRIPVEGDAFGPDLWQMKTDNSLVRPGRRLPMDLAPSPRIAFVLENGPPCGAGAARRLSDRRRAAAVAPGRAAADPRAARDTRDRDSGRTRNPLGRGQSRVQAARPEDAPGLERRNVDRRTRHRGPPRIEPGRAFARRGVARCPRRRCVSPGSFVAPDLEAESLADAPGHRRPEVLPRSGQRQG